MKTWTTASSDRWCGQCGAAIPKDAALLVIQIGAIGRRLYRCEGCADVPKSPDITPDMVEPEDAELTWITLKGGFGLVLPWPAIHLALELERRGFTMVRDDADGVTVTPQAGLTPRDYAEIERWHRHLAAIVTYDADTA